MKKSAGCDSPGCTEEATRKGILTNNYHCPECGRTHYTPVSLCDAHLRDMKLKEACYNLARLAIHAEPPFHLALNR